MNVVIENVNTAAMVLGYPVLVIIVVLLALLGSLSVRAIYKIFLAMRYERRQRRNVDRDWDNIEASWALELDSEVDFDEPEYYNNYDTDVFPAIPAQRHDTVELDQLFNYQEDRS